MTNLFVDIGNICDGLFGVYKAVRYLLNISDEISDDQMDKKTVRYYFNHKEENEYGWCNNAQRQTLAILYDMIICLIELKQNDENQPLVEMKFYGEKLLLEKKFIYVLYEEATLSYYPLPVVGKMITLAHHDIVKNLLGVFIRDKLGYAGEIDLDNFGEIAVSDASIPMEFVGKEKMKTIPDSTLMIKQQKRECPGIDDIPMSTNNNQTLLSSNSTEDYDANKRIKLEQDSPDPKIVSWSFVNDDVLGECNPPVNDEHHEEKVKLGDGDQSNCHYETSISQTNCTIDQINRPLFYIT